MVIQSRENVEWKKRELAKYMPFPLAYRILAQSPLEDTHLTVTASRDRALRYFHLLLAQPGWSEQRVEVGARAYTKDTLEQLP